MPWPLWPRRFSPRPRAVVEDWQLDPYHSEAIVLVDHYGLARLGGIFGKLTGTVKVDASDWSGWAIDVKIPVFEFSQRTSRAPTR